MWEETPPGTVPDFGGTAVLDHTVQMARDLAPYAGAAITAYGAGVLTEAQSQATDATVAFGRRLLLRLTGRTPNADATSDADAGTSGTDQASEAVEPTVGQRALADAVEQLAATPATPDTAAVLRFHLERLLRARPDLAAEVAAWPRPAGPVIGHTTTHGDRSPIIGTLNGDAHFGDTHPGPAR